MIFELTKVEKNGTIITKLKGGGFAMARDVFKYVGLALVAVGIVVVMKSLFSSDTEWKETETKASTKKAYNVTVSLIDKDTNAYISDSKLVVKNSKGNVVDEWTTSDGVHLISNLSNGTYTLNQETTSSKYFLNTDTITFKIEGKDQKVSMYNIALTEEQIKNGVNNNPNISSNETAVENTSSFGSLMPYFIATICILLGGCFLYKTCREN